MSIIKDLPNKQEVIEYMQAFLGNGPAALTFTKFFITRKLALFGKTKTTSIVSHAVSAEVNKSFLIRFLLSNLKIILLKKNKQVEDADDSVSYRNFPSLGAAGPNKGNRKDSNGGLHNSANKNQKKTASGRINIGGGSNLNAEVSFAFI